MVSEGIVIALIKFAGAVIGAAIAGFATIAAAGIKGKEGGSISCGLVGLLALLGAAGGLVLGAIFGASLIQVQSNPTVLSPQSLPSLVTQQPIPSIIPTEEVPVRQPQQPATVIATQELSLPTMSSRVSPTFTPILQSSQLVWQDLGVFYASDYVILGDQQNWIVFQVWDGRDTSTTVHGILEPGWFLRIPPPLQGTIWAVSGYDPEYIITRVMQMRDEVVQRDGIAVPPLVYVGTNPAPPGYTSQVPSGWVIQH